MRGVPLYHPPSNAAKRPVPAVDVVTSVMIVVLVIVVGEPIKTELAAEIKPPIRSTGAVEVVEAVVDGVLDDAEVDDIDELPTAATLELPDDADLLVVVELELITVVVRVEDVVPTPKLTQKALRHAVVEAVEELDVVELGVVELVAVELGVVELDTVEIGVVELGVIETGVVVAAVAAGVVVAVFKRSSESVKSPPSPMLIQTRALQVVLVEGLMPLLEEIIVIAALLAALVTVVEVSAVLPPKPPMLIPILGTVRICERMDETTFVGSRLVAT